MQKIYRHSSMEVSVDNLYWLRALSKYSEAYTRDGECVLLS